MSHHCSCLLIQCMDFRMVKETMNWLKEKDLIGDCDIVSLAGSSKSLIDENDLEVKKFILKQIETSYNLHNMRKIILLHHSDCGAYNSSYHFRDEEEEFSKQLDDMQAAEETLKNLFEDIEIIKIWAKMKDNKGNEVEFSEIN